MSIYLPECNAQLQHNSGAVGISFPASSSFKAANTGCVTGFWVQSPDTGYYANVVYNMISRGLGLASGNDGYIRFDQAATSLSAMWRSSGTIYFPSTTITVPQGKKMLVLMIVNPTNVHLVACEPGGIPIVGTTANSTFYALNSAAADVWTKIGAGNGASLAYSHYGPIEEAFFLTGTFPESGGIPDSTLIQNIANGTQDLATLHTQLTTGTKKFRYRMMQQDDLADAYAIVGNLTPINTSVDKVLLSSGPLRPIAMTPNYTRHCPSQVVFGTPGNAATAFATIKVEGGTYTGTAPFAIQARLRKEDGSVLVNWQVVDAAPAAGVWQPSQFTGVPMTAGDLTVDFRKVDSGGALIDDMVSSYGFVGAGFNVLQCSQSQGTYHYLVGSGVAIPSAIRSQVTFYDDGLSKWRTYKLSSLNPNARAARGMRQAAMEIHALYPGVPIHFATVGIQGQPITAFIPAGAFVGQWAAFKAKIGLIQPYWLFPMGHSSNSNASYETYLGQLVTQAITDVGAPIGVIHAMVPRYAGAGTGTNYDQVNFCRSGIRDRIANNPTEKFGCAIQMVKCDTADTGPHPMDSDVGHGRAGAALAWGLMSACRAVEDVPLTLTAATKVLGGTAIDLSFGPVT